MPAIHVLDRGYDAGALPGTPLFLYVWNRHVYEIRMCMRMYETGMCMIQAWAPFGSRGAALREHGIKSYVYMIHIYAYIHIYIYIYI